MSNQAERVMTQQNVDEPSAETLQIPMNEGNTLNTNGDTEELSRLNSTNNCEECYRKYYPNCVNLRIHRPVSLTIADDDNPPPYSALIPQNHEAWYYKFPSDNSHVRNTITLEQFQQRVTSSSTETCPDCSRPRSLDAIPLNAFGSSKTNPILASPENLRIAKMTNLPRRYGTILVAVIVVVSLMVLSLIVRFVVKRSFWRSSDSS